MDVGENEVDGDLLTAANGVTFPAIDYAYERIPKAVIAKYMGFFGLLKPSGAVQKRISQVAIGDDVIRVQIRNSTDANDHASVPRISSYIQTMSDYPPSAKFFLSAMDPSIGRYFIRLSRTGVLSFPGKTINP